MCGAEQFLGDDTPTGTDFDDSVLWANIRLANKGVYQLPVMQEVLS